MRLVNPLPMLAIRPELVFMTVAKFFWNSGFLTSSVNLPITRPIASPVCSIPVFRIGKIEVVIFELSVNCFRRSLSGPKTLLSPTLLKTFWNEAFRPSNVPRTA
jgi:hypothetical protein